MRSFNGLFSLIVLFVIILFIQLLGDLEKSSAADFVIERFPTQVGKSWDYRRTFYMVIYDTGTGETVGEYLLKDSLHAEFVSIDSLNDWECYRYHSQLFEEGDVFFDVIWYAHPDTAFLEIAYTPPTHSGPPKEGSEKLYIEFAGKHFKSTDELRLYLHQMRASSFAYTFSETTYWKPPKKLFVFPLMVGTEWISMTMPWLERREVMEEEFIQVPAGGFLTLTVDIRPELKHIFWHEWLSEPGVIKDSLHLDSLMVYNEFGELVGYMVSYDKYELIGLATTEVEDRASETKRPVGFSLDQNYPNPFNPQTVIRFSLFDHHPTKTTLTIYNVLGKRVKTLLDEQKKAGSYGVVWDGKDDQGKEVASGIYFCNLKVGEFCESKKMLLLK
jgi:hypothetical protein